MKTIKNIFIALALVLGLGTISTSCVNDLDQMPSNPNDITQGDFQDDPEGYMNRVMADVYLQFATYGANGNSPVWYFDGGMASFQRALFIAQEMPTDEACWLWDPESYGTLNTGIVTSNLDAVFGFYSRLMINITLCNQFIQTVNEGLYSLNEEQNKLAQSYITQCKILRGACYYYMIDLFGDIWYADENDAVGSIPAQRTRKEVFDIVTTELEGIVASWNGPEKPYYGFVGKDVAEALLVKFYLNAEVYTGTPMYDKCLTHANNIIARLGKGGFKNSGLAPHYQMLFAYNNDQFSNASNGPALQSEVNEIIWTLPQNRVELTSYQASTFMIVGWVGTNGVQVTLEAPMRSDYDTEEAYQAALDTYNEIRGNAKTAWQTKVDYTLNGVNYSFDPEQDAHVSQQWYNVGGGWKCMVAREEFVNKFDWEDDKQSISKDVRTNNWCTSKFGFVNDNVSLTGDYWGTNGYLTPKYNNFAYNEDGTIDVAASAPISSDSQVGGDYAMIRLAEIYLSAAEAIMAQGGDMSKALEYVNLTRTRAGLGELSSLSLTALRDERCRELYQELTRRTDLIRYGQWTNGYNWAWKGGVRNGTNLPEYTKLYPLPSRILSSSGYKQNPGY